jgi:hypothetical protein
MRRNTFKGIRGQVEHAQRIQPVQELVHVGGTAPRFELAEPDEPADTSGPGW